MSVRRSSDLLSQPHCQATSTALGFTSLSCTPCHYLYQPDCVQVSLASTNSLNMEFYCNDSQPLSLTLNPGNLISVAPQLQVAVAGPSGVQIDSSYQCSAPCYSRI